MKRFIEIDTPLEPDMLLFHKMRAKEELSRLFEYELDLLSPNRDINLDDVLGKSVTVKLELDDEEVVSRRVAAVLMFLSGTTDKLPD